MRLFVHKFPVPDRIAECRELPDDQSLPAPYEEMTQAAFTAFRDLWSARRAAPVEDAQPAYNAATHRLEAYLEVDEPANCFRRKWRVVAMTTEERERTEDSAELLQLRTALEAAKTHDAPGATAAAKLENRVTRLENIIYVVGRLVIRLARKCLP